MNDDRAGAGEGPDAGADGKARDEGEQGGPAAGGSAENGGEDDSSTEKNGDDSHLHDDQKSRSLGS